MEEQYAVVVEWQNPRTGHCAPFGNRLAIPFEVVQDFQYISCDWDEDTERYLFADREDAEAFKTHIDRNFKSQYFVIDEDENVVCDGDGEPIVAWEPVLRIIVHEPQEAEQAS